MAPQPPSPLQQQHDRDRDRGMADYSYAANHNLVLLADRSGLPRRDNEPSGEPVSLAGSVSVSDMGTRAARDTSELAAFRKARKPAPASAFAGVAPDPGAAATTTLSVAALSSSSSSSSSSFAHVSAASARRQQQQRNTAAPSILEATENVAINYYAPRTPDTRAVYETMLAFISARLGDVPADLLRDAAHSLLLSLRGRASSSSSSTGAAASGSASAPTIITNTAAIKQECEEILDTLPDEDFSSLLLMSRKLTDYNPADYESNLYASAAINDSSSLAEPTLDETQGVAVIFEEDDDDDDKNKRKFDYEGKDLDANVAYYVEDNLDYEESENDENYDASAVTGEATSLAEPKSGFASFNVNKVSGTQTSIRASAKSTGISTSLPFVASDSLLLGRPAGASPAAAVLLKSTPAKSSLKFHQSNDKEQNNDNNDDDDDVESRPAEFGLVKENNSSNVNDNLVLEPSQIDAFWLQRAVAAKFPDPEEAKGIAARVFEILESAKSLRELENELNHLFAYKCFDLSKLITRNSKTILYGTRLANASSEEERAAIIAKLQEQANTGLPKPHQSFEPTIDTEGRNERNEQGDEKEEQEEEEEEGLAEIAAFPDLDYLAFPEGGHTMSNKNLKIPSNYTHSISRSFDEYSIPAPKHPPFDPSERLVPIAELPRWTHPAFGPETKTLNRIQSRLYRTALESSENMLVCAPTGSGKTNVALLSVLGTLGNYMSGVAADNITPTFDLHAFKIVYIAPMKALVQEMVVNFRTRLAPYNMIVEELTGDAQLNKQQLQAANMIITTPEKWDVVTRKGIDRSYTALVRLIIIDEVHLLHDDRGPVLEAIVARTLRHVKQTRDHVRIVGLSATLPNYPDVAAFLRVKQNSGLFFFSSAYRPIPLSQQFYGVKEKKALKRLSVMNEIVCRQVIDCVANSSTSDQVLVFVHSRKDTAKTARIIRDAAINAKVVSSFTDGVGCKELLKSQAESAIDHDLKDLLPFGVAIHHAGLSRSDRAMVEDLFKERAIQVLCCTATLAWGVNLPARTVIIKGTQVYNAEKGAWVELSSQDVLQMLGRAGRPQFEEKEGRGIIITTHSELPYYLSLLNTQLPIESQLIRKLPEVMNAEIVLGSITSAAEALEWLRYTYLFVRMLRDPSTYKLSTADDGKGGKENLAQHCLRLAHTALCELDAHNVCRYDRRTRKVASTEWGRIASHYYVSHTSMSQYMKHMHQHALDIDLFRVFAMSHEFRFIPVRQEEKTELSNLLARVPVPVKDNPSDPAAKIIALLQAYISQLKLEGFVLMSDMVYVTQSAQRLFRALFEIALRRNWGQIALRCLDLCRAIERRQWPSMTPLRQFKKLGEDVIKRTESKALPFERFLDLTPEELGEHVGSLKAGRLIHRAAHQVPRVGLQIQVLPLSRSLVKIDLTLTPEFTWDDKVHGPALGFWIFVTDVCDDVLLHYEYLVVNSRHATEDHALSFVVPLFDPLSPNYFITVACDTWLHPEKRVAVSFQHLALPDKFHPPTELLELQPLPVSSALGQHAQYFTEIDFFNPIQTQAFHSIFMTDESTLICAPNGSNTSVLADLAVLRALLHPKRTRDSKIVCMCADETQALFRRQRWEAKFGSLCKIELLTGTPAHDLQLLERAEVIVASCASWDALSRRWRQRKNVYNTMLFVIEDVQLLGDETVGVAMEIACSRMRFISAQREAAGAERIRFVALGASIANASDVGTWLGCSTMNFHPSARTRALDITLRGMAVSHAPSLLLAAANQTYSLLNSLEASEQALVFLPGSAESILFAPELLAWTSPRDIWPRTKDQSNEEEEEEEEEEIAEKLARILCEAEAEDAESLDYAELAKRLYAHGIGLLHESMSQRQAHAVRRLYTMKRIGVLLCSRVMSRALDDILAHQVIVVCTQYFDNQKHAYVDYAVSDVMQMIGFSTFKVHIATSRNKREYYRRFIHEPMPVESLLDQVTLMDHFNAEIVSRTIDNKQAAVDYLTWTFLYRRMSRNPNYYGLTGRSEQHYSDFLSDLVENVVAELVTAKCVTSEDEFALEPLALGLIAAYHNVSATTVEMFSMSLTPNTKLRGLIDVIAHATEFSELPVRRGEPALLRRLYNRACPCKLGDDVNFTHASVKAHVLLQCHFSRHAVPAGLRNDMEHVLRCALPLVYAAIEVISHNSWLNVALCAMELAQMCVQGLWDRDPAMQQAPFITKKDAEYFKQTENVTTPFDLMELDEDKQAALFEHVKLSPAQLSQVAAFVNGFPNIELTYTSPETVSANADAEILVKLSRDAEQDVPEHVMAPRFPVRKGENWWLVVGDAKEKQLCGIKRVTLARELSVRVGFSVPTEGKKKLTLYLVSDSYLGCDQEYEFDLTVDPEEPQDEDEDEEEEEEEEEE